ncbi:MAG TPA: guanylate kinase [Acidimicrobiales bacterium]|nr:guanylate kinase [Acidimicrobiales bacterium]
MLVVSGPGGVGKGTLVSRLCEQVPGLWLSRSWTTRARRPGEAPDAYTFVDRSTFEKRVADGGFLEWAELPANGHLYGTPWPEPPPGSDVVLEIDVQGAAQVRQRHPDAVIVLVVPPSRGELAARMRTRGDAEDAIASRLAIAGDEEARGRRLADHVVVNDDVDRAAAELAGILRHSRRPHGRS